MLLVLLFFCRLMLCRILANLCVTYYLFQTVFKTLPGTAATCVELGGPTGQPRDRIFVSSGTVVRGYNRKGKVFLDFNTNAAETIRSL
jgi:hypothetical protein